jgi:hypothetical protein
MAGGCSRRSSIDSRSTAGRSGERTSRAAATCNGIRQIRKATPGDLALRNEIQTGSGSRPGRSGRRRPGWHTRGKRRLQRPAASRRGGRPGACGGAGRPLAWTLPNPSASVSMAIHAPAPAPNVAALIALRSRCAHSSGARGDCSVILTSRSLRPTGRCVGSGSRRDRVGGETLSGHATTRKD